MAKFFISYRRSDSQHQADRLHTALKPYVENPDHDIFIDVDNIPFGVDFVEYLGGKVAQCEVLLTLIGDRWLAIDPQTGKRRIDDPEDFVRIEIAQALERGIPVVPVLLDGASVPTPETLPDDLKPLARRNGVPIQRLTFDADVARLINGLPVTLPQIVPQSAPAPNSSDGGAAKMWGGIEHSLDIRDYSEFKDHFSDSKWAFEAGRRARQLTDWSNVDQENATAIADFRKLALETAPLFEALEVHTKKVMRRANDLATRSRAAETADQMNVENRPQQALERPREKSDAAPLIFALVLITLILVAIAAWNAFL